MVGRRDEFDWQSIIQRERYYAHATNKDYSRCLAQAIPHGMASLIYWPFLSLQSRPHPIDVETALRQACLERPQAREAWWDRINHLSQVRQSPPPTETLLSRLQGDDWFQRFVAFHVLSYQGGEVIDQLCSLASEGSGVVYVRVLRLLHSISSDTTVRISRQVNDMICPDCLTRCRKFAIQILPNYTLPNIGFYGCRTCKQSKHFFHRSHVVTVLDRMMEPKTMKQYGCLHVNWFGYRYLFDFGQIKIIQASDEDVERFAVKVGNDTDEIREARYKEMRCVIDSGCELSENTLRILKSMFGDVRYRDQ